MIHLGRRWYLVRWPYRRRYADYLWTTDATGIRKVWAHLRELKRSIAGRIPFVVRRRPR